MIRRLPAYLALALAFAYSAFAASRERTNFDAQWSFAFGHPFDAKQDFDHATSYFSYLTKAGYGDGPADAKFDVSTWRKLDLPHDWAVEAPFDARGSHSHGYKAVGRAFPERSVGWYRKSFDIPASDLGRRISIEFDGVHRDSVVWVNGFYLGRQPSGSTSFRYDLTDYLNYGGPNIIAVRADVTIEEGWYYEGAGIYRHTWLTKTDPLHVAPWGTFVSTEMPDDFSSATITARASLVNEGTAATAFTIDQTVLGPDGSTLATATLTDLNLAAGSTQEFTALLTVPQPQLWSLETPALHRLITDVRADGKRVDRYETTFGIRSVRFDADQGFFLNGQHVILKGTNNHQDHAGVGVAIPDALTDYRIRRLKAFGNNAYRTSHQPPAPELLEACDRLGMLVLDETRLMGPSPEQLSQLEALIRRDRNHPSVILWSVGNEEWAIEGNEKGARITASMQAFAQRLDPTRRITVAISGGWGAGSSTVVDVMGYNYFTHGSTDEQHAKFPHQPSVGTEETTAQGTRSVYFTDAAHAHLAPLAKGDSGGHVELGWKHYAERPYLAGVFFWTGFDYRGESTPFSFPANSSQYGIMDTCGFPKDQFYYLKSWWTDEPVLHLYPHWNWPDKIGETLTVGCYSNHEEVELFLNGASLGKQTMPRNGHLEWQVVYQPGTLEAHGYRAGIVVEKTQIETTGAPTALVLTPDRPTLTADGVDVTVVTVSSRDAAGRTVPTANLPVDFTITGGSIIGVGNGDPSCNEPDRFIESISLVSIDNWRGRLSPITLTKPSDSTDLPSMAEMGKWTAPRPKTGECYDLTGSFDLASIPTDADVAINLPAFGMSTSVWLNGHQLASDADTRHAGLLLPLDRTLLTVGQNHVQLVVIPVIDGQNHIPERTQIGCIRFRTAPPPARRSLFNGFAQVIVQSTVGAPEIKLTANAAHLTPATTTVTTIVPPVTAP